MDVGHEGKRRIIKEVIDRNDGKIVFDSAGKYGAGLALETLGKILKELNIPSEKVVISNKLGWRRVPLTTKEPTFEPGVWVNLRHDAVQDISFEGILHCYDQGNRLLGEGPYNAQIVSVHDPDEYLAAASDSSDVDRRRAHIIDAYRALEALKDSGKVLSIGVGAKDFSAIDFISGHVQLDWAMFACSLTVHSHCSEARKLMKKLHDKGVRLINSGVFNSGFLVGSDFYNYQKVSRESRPDLFDWRDKFYKVCDEYEVPPAAACIQFSLLLECPMETVAVNSATVDQVGQNLRYLDYHIPREFWHELKLQGLIEVGP
jgi:D-threo-aldose 1-dehydrogenase